MARLASALAMALALAAAVWLVAGAATVAGQPAGPAASGGGGDGGGQRILVMLRIAPQHFHPNGGYGGAYDDGMARAAMRRIASRIARARGLTLASDWPMPLIGMDCFVMTLPAGRSAPSEAALVSRDPVVAWAQPVELFQTQAEVRGSDDPLFLAQPAASAWRLADLHQMATGRNVFVAVIDSQIERTHPDLAGQVAVAENFVTDHPARAETHGTGVAGVIAARAGNAVGIVGVAPRARLMALRACWQLQASAASPTVCDSLSLAQALQFAIEHDTQIINLSLSGPPDRLLATLLDLALARGITVVAAYDRGVEGGGFPASHRGVVAVTDGPMAPARAGVYSAPGRDVPTTQPGGQWSLVNGSSYAAAHVSGLFALLRERSPRARGAAALVVTRAGRGAIDACASLLRAAGPCDCACARAEGATGGLASR